MYAIPMATKEGNWYDLFVILEDANIERMRRYDPPCLEVCRMSEQMPALAGRALRNLTVAFATAEEVVEVQAALAAGDLGALRKLTRGWEFRPDLGDHDGPPVSLLRKPGSVPS